MNEQVFTIEEAQRLLPQLEEFLMGIRHERLSLRRLGPEVQLAAKAASNGGGSHCGPRYILALEQILKSVEDINGLGVLLKDPDTGLCDFPFMMDGRLVYLCWKLGESRIAWWHEIQSGYTSRRPLDVSLTPDP